MHPHWETQTCVLRDIMPAACWQPLPSAMLCWGLGFSQPKAGPLEKDEQTIIFNYIKFPVLHFCAFGLRYNIQALKYRSLSAELRALCPLRLLSQLFPRVREWSCSPTRPCPIRVCLGVTAILMLLTTDYIVGCRTSSRQSRQ